MCETTQIAFAGARLRRALLMACLVPGAALAADLGRLTVLSGVGEPLRAEIEVVSVGAGEGAALRARVPPPDVFWRANLEPPPNLGAFRASIESRPGRRYVVALRSNAPPENPFVQLLVELDSPAGTVVREYPFLLEERGAQVGPPLALPRAEKPPAAALAAPARREAAPATPSRAPAPLAAGAYVVRPGDTLGSIARATAPAGATVEQTLVALHRGNPEAFEGGDMNRLRAGATMVIPTAEAATSITQAEAVQAIRPRPTDGADEARPAAKPALTTPGRDRLQLTNPSDPASTDPRSGGASGDDLVALQRALADAQERIALLERALRDVQGGAAVRDGATPVPDGEAARAVTVPAPSGFSPLRSEAGTFLEEFGGLLIGLFVVSYLSWIVMPIKTIRAWRARRRRARRKLEAALDARFRPRRRR